MVISSKNQMQKAKLKTSPTKATLKLILYKTLLQPLWLYGVVIWGSAKKSNKRTIQAFQNICCRIITGAPWYISNNAINSDLRICSVNETATIYYKRFHAKIIFQPQPAHQGPCYTSTTRKSN
ncbi:Hypothetical protein CINCED_3A019135 [Cinara cedri]|uniref:Uncharacterized protein n=1 Tax=Cinara cedri TaxID=506608 RepID=A0A5E4NSU2_9HEMI|nr:Hypothetical protein CINCED_3A019135 [Cinara cedri]